MTVNISIEELDLCNTSRDVFADREYAGQARETVLQQRGLRTQIQLKDSCNRPVSECQQRRNHRITKIRSRVEHVFGAMDQVGDMLIRAIGQTCANFGMTMMVTCYNLNRSR